MLSKVSWIGWLLVGMIVVPGLVFTATNFGTLAPTADDTFDLGESGNEWRDIHIDGQAYLDSADIGISTSTQTPATDNTYDLGAVGKEWKDLYINGTAYLDSVDVGADNVLQTMCFELTDVDAARNVMFMTLDRGIQVRRADYTQGGAVSGGTLGFTFKSGASQIVQLALTSLAYLRTASTATPVNFASASICTLEVHPGGGASSGHPGYLVLQYQNH